MDLTKWWRRGDEASGAISYDRGLGMDMLPAFDGPARVLAIHLIGADELVTVGIGVASDGPSMDRQANYWLAIREAPDGSISARAWREVVKAPPQEEIRIEQPKPDGGGNWFAPHTPAAGISPVVEETP